MKFLRICLFMIFAFACESTFAQGKIPAQVKDFRTNVEQEGRRTFLKGDANPGPEGTLIIRNAHIETFKADGAPDNIIDAAEAVFDQTKSKNIWSDKELSMRSADGALAIKGVGFLREEGTSRLTVSNKVEMTIRSQAVLGGGGSTNRTGTNIVVTADQMTYTAELVLFTGQVHVVDPQGEVRCQTLKVRLDQKNTWQEIEAIDDVILTQGETTAQGKRALYTKATDLLRLSGGTRWRMAEREGESELLILDRVHRSVRAETKVRMTLPSAELFSTNSTDTVTKKTNQITISADTFDYAPTNAITHGPIAIYNGNVHTKDPQADLDAELLTIFFNPTNKLTRAVAERAVKITRPGTAVQGERAVFENEEVTITGHPVWQHEGKSGKSDILVFNPRTREIRAVNVQMELPHTGDMSFFGEAKSAATNKSAPIKSASITNVLLVTAMYFTNKNNLAIFAEKVRAAEPKGQIDADRVDVSFTSSNRLQRLLARGDVILTEGVTQAIGQEADFNVDTDLGRLSGNPKVMQEGKEITAREFTFNRKNGEFRPLPPFKAILRKTHLPANSSATNRASSFK